MEEMISSDGIMGAGQELIATSTDDNAAFQAFIKKIVEKVQSETENKPAKEMVMEIEVNGVQFTVTRNGNMVEEEPNALSPREKEIVRLIARGLPNKIIATVLEISPWTVASHLRRIYAKLGVKSRAEMVAQVLGKGKLNATGLEG